MEYFVKFNEHVAAISKDASRLKKIKDFNKSRGSVFNFFACDRYGVGDYPQHDLVSKFFLDQQNATELDAPIVELKRLLDLAKSKDFDMYQIKSQQYTDQIHRLRICIDDDRPSKATLSTEIHGHFSELPAIRTDVWKQMFSIANPKFLHWITISKVSNMLYLTSGDDSDTRVVCAFES